MNAFITSTQQKLKSPVFFSVFPIGFLLSLLGLVVGEAFISGALLSLSPESGTYAVGKTFVVDVRLATKDPVNVAGLSVRFPSAQLEVLDVSKQGSLFNLWIEEPEFTRTPGVIHFSGGVLGGNGFRGEGKLVSIFFRARSAGEAQVTIADAQVLAHDGVGTNILSRKEGATYTLSADGRILFDLDQNGVLDMKDVGVFVTKWGGAYETTYDLNRDGEIDYSDLALLVLVLVRGG